MITTGGKPCRCATRFSPKCWRSTNATDEGLSKNKCGSISFVYYCRRNIVIREESGLEPGDCCFFIQATWNLCSYHVCVCWRVFFFPPVHISSAQSTRKHDHFEKPCTHRRSKSRRFGRGFAGDVRRNMSPL